MMELLLCTNGFCHQFVNTTTGSISPYGLISSACQMSLGISSILLYKLCYKSARNKSIYACINSN